MHKLFVWVFIAALAHRWLSSVLLSLAGRAVASEVEARPRGAVRILPVLPEARAPGLYRKLNAPTGQTPTPHAPQMHSEMDGDHKD